MEKLGAEPQGEEFALEKGSGQPQKIKILLVDDEENVLQALKRLLRKEKVEVSTTTSPEKALQLLKTNQYAVIVSDQRMPTSTGTQLMQFAQKISPDTVRIILTGYADVQAAIEAINKGAVSRFLAKPWNDIELRLAIRQAIAQYKLVKEKEELKTLADDQYKLLQDIAIELESRVEERTREIAAMNKQLEENFLISVRVMAQLTGMHSEVVGNHSKRVAMLCHEVGIRKGMSAEDLFQLEAAASLHNIGNVGIDPEVFKKPKDSLTAEEKEKLQNNPLRGEAVLKLVPNLTKAANYLRHMQELFNGQGYPEHLKGEDIPLASRIIAVVEAYDTFLNLSSSFESTTPSDALRYLQDRSPSFFDPDVVSVLATCLTEEKRRRQESEIVEINLKELRPGMVLSQDLILADGKKLLSKDNQVQQDDLYKIKKYQETNSILATVYVYRKKPEPEEPEAGTD